MKPVDKRMMECPLKHAIRAKVWARYARSVKPTGCLEKYLTLYSPAMMDIKYLHAAGLLKYEGNVFVGVAAVTNDPKAFAGITGGGKGRPEFVARADLNKLLTRPSDYPRFAKDLRSMFPFDVINLDYCNALFYKGTQLDVSLHVDALQAVIAEQRRAGGESFALLVTSLAEVDEIADHFLDSLESRIANNVSQSEPFAARMENVLGTGDGAELRRTNYSEFVPLGIVKFIADLLTSAGYEIQDCETASIFRDCSQKPNRWVLHTACSVGMPRPGRLRDVGRQAYLERNVVKYLDRRGAGEILVLRESSDRARYEEEYGAQIRALAAESFEVRVPEPEGDSG